MGRFSSALLWSAVHSEQCRCHSGTWWNSGVDAYGDDLDEHEQEKIFPIICHWCSGNFPLWGYQINSMTTKPQIPIQKLKLQVTVYLFLLKIKTLNEDRKQSSFLSLFERKKTVFLVDDIINPLREQKMQKPSGWKNAEGKIIAKSFSTSII